MNLKDFLFSYFASDQYIPLRTKELADLFGLNGEARIEFYDLIDEMLIEESIKMSKRGRIKAYPNHSKEKKQVPHAINRSKGVLDPSHFSIASLSTQENQDIPSNRSCEASESFGGVSIEERQIPQDKPPQPSVSEKQDDMEEKERNPLVGVLRGNPKGFAFFHSDVDGQEDYFIRAEDLHGALHGDRVRIRETSPTDPQKGRNANGQVVEIIARNKERIIGLYDKEEGYGFVIPDRKNYFKDIYIDEDNSMQAQDQDKVIVELIDFDSHEENPEGRIVEVIGQAGEKGVDITSVARQFELPYEFSEETKEQAAMLPKEVDPMDFRDRRDLRKKFTVTIDGPDAKDFDDAITVEKRGQFYNLYVHIADVSHYVKEGSPIDTDAYARGNSVYLLDRVLPMLPVELSNGLCSLNPEVDRLAMTTQMTLDHAGNVVDHQFYTSVIRSNHRLVYDDVSDYMEKGIPFNEDEELFPFLDLMKEIYLLLANQREARGTLDFDFPETKITLNEAGRAVSVGVEERRIANRVIEEFMILNNVVVGTSFFEKQLPFLYRIHEQPSTEAVNRLNQALAVFHYAPVSLQPTSLEIRDILKRAEGRKEQEVLNMFVLQSMSRAVYSPKPLMHFGLAQKHYSHFTSPIRRYSDLIAHRLLKELLAGHPREDDEVRDQLIAQCQHVTETEQKAEDAERDVVAMKCAEYMQPWVGQEFEGCVASLTNFGIFITLDNTVEGLAHFRDMTDDYYFYDEEHMVVRGEYTKKEVHNGDRVRVVLVSSNPIQREIDFQLVGFTGKRPEKHSQRKVNEKRTNGRLRGFSPRISKKNRKKRKKRRG